MTSFEFSKSVKKNEAKLSSSVQLENENDVICYYPCNKYEEIITFYPLFIRRVLAVQNQI